ncbi:MAG: hypothetical protein WC807_16020 [Hyphomicrobium sp.]|jgi:hypothetical protein
MSNIDNPTRFTRGIIVLIAVVQVILGVIFVTAPHAFAGSLGLAPTPGWTDWMFAQFGARALGFAYGMLLVLKDARRHVGWIRAMIGVQVIDWIGTVLALAAGKVTLAQVTTAPIFPILFVIVLALELRRQARSNSTVAAHAV